MWTGCGGALSCGKWSNGLSVSHPQILDVGCGTADLSLAFSRLGSVIGCDFCHPMLTLGKRKVAMARNPRPVRLLAADALSLPFPDSSFGVVVSAFVVRNLASLEKGLAEMRRVLGEGGLLGILDFSLPPVPVFGPLYRYYFTKILPKNRPASLRRGRSVQLSAGKRQEFSSPGTDCAS